jgi:pimeloyl-ACP methyl ester carboxylesterase
VSCRAFLVVAALATAGCPSFHAGRMPNPPAGATFAEVDGVDLRYIDEGEGPAVVLIHGYSSSLDIWRQVVPVLAKHHRVIAIDLKGFGYSGRPPGDYSPAAQARLAWKLLDQRGVTDVAVVGHSWGTSVAMAMVLSRPAQVRRVALYSAYVYEDQVPSFFRWARIGGMGELLFGLFYRQRVEDRVALAFYSDEMVTAEGFDRVHAELSRPGTVAAALATARGQRYTEMEKRYGEIQQPTLLIWGRDDLVTPIGYGHRLVNQLPNGRLLEIERCGHVPMFEARNRTTRALADFLARDLPAPEAP